MKKSKFHQRQKYYENNQKKTKEIPKRKNDGK